jgi:hypothetical protein
MDTQREQRVIVVTVHGTNDSALGTTDKKWWEADSPFSTNLRRRLAERGMESEVAPFIWSGANSALERERAAHNLARRIKQAARGCAEVHVVGHSHGGNVANDAARILRRKKKHAPHKIASMTTVGTPFFKSGLSFANTIGWSALLAIFAVGVIMFSAMTIAGLAPDLTFPGTDLLRRHYAMIAAWAGAFPRIGGADIGLPLLIAVNVIALALVIPSTLQGARRMLRVRARRHGAQAFLAIWHPNDEAIAFLRAMDVVKTEPLPRGAMWRSSRMSGLVIGVRAVIAALIAAVAAIMIGAIAPNVSGAHGVGAGISLLIFVLIGSPLLFSLIYLAVRLWAGVGAELFARRHMNNWVVGLMRNMAFGRDGDERLAEISVRPHARRVEEHILTGALAEKMKADAHEQAAKLIERYRWGLFNVESGAGEALTEITQSAMTWRSLVHTSYFDYDEVGAEVARFIIAHSKLAIAEAPTAEAA